MIGFPYVLAFDQNLHRDHAASRSSVIHYEISKVTLQWAHLAPAIHFV